MLPGGLPRRAGSTPNPRLPSGCRTGAIDRHEARPPDQAEQVASGVEIPAPRSRCRSNPEEQAAAGGAHRVAGTHSRPSSDFQCGKTAVGGSQARRVGHHDVQGARHRSGKADHSPGSRPNRASRCRGVLVAAISGTPQAPRRPEPLHDRRMHWRLETGARRLGEGLGRVRSKPHQYNRRQSGDPLPDAHC